MIVGAALTPGPPLLAAELAGGDREAARLRDASTAAVAELVAAGPDVVAVVGASERTAAWPADDRLQLARFDGRPRSGPGGDLPLSVGIGALLLDEVGYGGPRLVRSVATDASPPTFDDLANEVRDVAPKVGLLVVADGSARRTLKAPGYLDPRAVPYDAVVEKAVRDGDLTALRDLDAALARELMAGGWPALQVLAVAYPSPLTTTVLYADAPYGVGYLVATLWPVNPST